MLKVKRLLKRTQSVLKSVLLSDMKKTHYKVVCEIKIKETTKKYSSPPDRESN